MIKNLLAVLAALADLLGRLRRRKEQEAHQREVDELQDNPGRWHDQHFNGRLHQSADLPDNAASTSQADTAQPDRDAGRGHDA